MAWTDYKDPDHWAAGWTEDGVDVTMPLAAITDLNATDADGATGDFRKVLFRMLEHWVGVYDALSAADKPTKMTMARTTTGGTDGQITHAFQIRFVNDISAQDVASE